MSLIDGVGDEVTDFFIVMTVLLVGWFAWCSTSIADQPLIRTVLILRDRAPTRIASIRANQQSASNLNVQDVGRPHSSETPEEETLETSNNSDSIQSSCPNTAAVGKYSFRFSLLFLFFLRCYLNPFFIIMTLDTSELSQEVSRPTESTMAEEVLIEAMDSFSNTDRSLLQRTVKANNSDLSLDQTTSSSSEPALEESTVSDSSNDITIKLKFINDDQKIVTGSLKEMLGNFKR